MWHGHRQDQSLGEKVPGELYGDLWFIAYVFRPDRTYMVDLYRSQLPIYSFIASPPFTSLPPPPPPHARTHTHTHPTTLTTTNICCINIDTTTPRNRQNGNICTFSFQITSSLGVPLQIAAGLKNEIPTSLAHACACHARWRKGTGGGKEVFSARPITDKRSALTLQVLPNSNVGICCVVCRSIIINVACNTR